MMLMLYLVLLTMQTRCLFSSGGVAIGLIKGYQISSRASQGGYGCRDPRAPPRHSQHMLQHRQSHVSSRTVELWGIQASPGFPHRQREMTEGFCLFRVFPRTRTRHTCFLRASFASALVLLVTTRAQSQLPNQSQHESLLVQGPGLAALADTARVRTRLIDSSMQMLRKVMRLSGCRSMRRHLWLALQKFLGQSG